MKPVDPFPRLLHAFFYEWMVQQRNASAHTVRSYRDTWRLFLRFVAQSRCRPVAQLTLGDLTASEATQRSDIVSTVVDRRVSSARLFASPRARMRARALNVDLATLHGSGPHGRIVEADVLSVGAEEPTRVHATPLARRLAHEHGVSVADIQGSGPGGRITQDDVLRAAQQRTPGERQPLSRIRKITAERMAASAQATARVTLFLDADFSEAARFRQQLQPEFGLETCDGLRERGLRDVQLLCRPSYLADFCDSDEVAEMTALKLHAGLAGEPPLAQRPGSTVSQIWTSPT